MGSEQCVRHASLVKALRAKPDTFSLLFTAAQNIYASTVEQYVTREKRV